jgi:hypothetical protein
MIHPLVTATIAAVTLVHNSPAGFKYPSDCCGENECRPIACSTIKTKADGSVIWADLSFNREQVKISGDALCHVCIGYNPHTSFRHPYCIFLSPTM